MKPSESEPICLISYEIARIRVGGEPKDRPGFWTAYREELELNQRTHYRNQHVWICRNQLMPLREKLDTRYFYRGERLVIEREVGEKSWH
jgi:hypothetical protein